MVHLNLDAESYSILKSIAREEERSMRVVASRAIRSYACVGAEHNTEPEEATSED